MSDQARKQGAQDAAQGKGPASTNGMSHEDANKYNAAYTETKNSNNANK